jgi:hypothetical protein
VDACTESAVKFTPGKKDEISLADHRKGTGRMGSGQRRNAYAEKLSAETRKKWRRKNA